MSRGAAISEKAFWTLSSDLRLIDEDYGCTLRGKEFGDGETYAAGCSGYDGTLSV
jgi:hypothetical protein